MMRRLVFAFMATGVVLDTLAKPQVLTPYSHVLGRACVSSAIITPALTQKSRVSCIGLNKVGCPGNLVAVEFTPNGRRWSVIGEYGAVGTGGERGSASADLPGRKLVASKIPRMLKPFEIDLLREDLKAALAHLRASRSR